LFVFLLFLQAKMFKIKIPNMRMKKYNFFLLTILTFAFFSCQRDLDVPPPLKYNGKATHTIAQLLSMRTSAGFDVLPDNMVIKGIVASSDKEGNCYKFLAIQDATGGIQIQINNGTLYQKYPVGQTLFVKCKELVLSEYNGLPQLNWLHQGTTERLPPKKEANVIFRDGIVGSEPTPAIIKNVSDIKPMMYNTLVKLENCRFEKPGTTYYDFALNYSTTSCNVILDDGTVIAARISQYAKFAKELTPKGKGNVMGILTVYKRNNGNIDNQLIIRSLDDVQVKEPVVDQTIAATDMSTNPLNNGWLQKNITGNQKWEYSTGTKNSLSIASNSTATESWLISPVYPQLNNYKNIKLLLNHRVPNNMGNKTNMKIYYTTKPLAANLVVTDWTELPTENSQYPSGGGEVTFEFPEQATNSPNFRIALRYNDDRPNSMWTIYSVFFKGISK